MRNLGEEMVLKERIVNLPRRTEQTRRYKPRRLERDEFRDWHELFESCKTAWGEVQLLDEDGLVHETIPVNAGFHVAFPFVEVDVVAKGY